MNFRFRQFATVCVLGGLTAACASGGGQVRVPKTAGVYKVGNPYQIGDTWYYPKEQPDYDETGIASWYGPTFYGKKTANGETFDAQDLTAAHRTLPMPVNVRVTNLGNGKSLILRVNDRGPFARNRIIDVSERAAELLGYKNAGTARVRVTYIGRADGNEGETPPAIASAVPAAPAGKVDTAALDIVPGATVAPPVEAGELPAPVPDTPPQPVPEPTGEVQQVPVPAVTKLYVQVGAFSTYENAARLVNRLGGNGLSISPITRNGQTLYRVRSGPFANTADADNALARVSGAGSNDARIVVDQ